MSDQYTLSNTVKNLMNAGAAWQDVQAAVDIANAHFSNHPYHGAIVYNIMHAADAYIATQKKREEDQAAIDAKAKADQAAITAQFDKAVSQKKAEIAPKLPTITAAFFVDGKPNPLYLYAGGALALFFGIRIIKNIGA